MKLRQCGKVFVESGSTISYYKATSLYLYFHPEYVNLLGGPETRCFFLREEATPGPLAMFVCAPLNKKYWLSHPKAPFGEIIIQKYLSNGQLEFFIGTICDHIASLGGLSLTIKTPATFYDPASQELLHKIYSNTGFRRIRTLSNHIIFVDQTPFADRVHPMEKRKLRKCKKAGLTAHFDKVTTTGCAFGFVEKYYSEKQYRLSVTQHELAQLRETFPENYPIFSSSHGEKLVALIVAVRPREDIIYTFLSAVAADYQTHSPIVAVLECIYNWCQQEGVKMIDLGTSLDHRGVLKESLVKFKERLGAVCCEKNEYEIHLNQIPRQFPSL